MNQGSYNLFIVLSIRSRYVTSLLILLSIFCSTIGWLCEIEITGT